MLYRREYRVYSIQYRVYSTVLYDTGILPKPTTTTTTKGAATHTHTQHTVGEKSVNINMTHALQILYSAEYFLRRQLQQSSHNDNDNNNPSSDYGIVNGVNSIDDFVFLPDNSSSSSSSNEQQQQQQQEPPNGRTIMTILYLCVLSLCFVVPVFYYIRMHCFEERVRREMELEFTNALELSTSGSTTGTSNHHHHHLHHHSEARAARRKYIEERRARIVQLFGPVRMVRDIYIYIYIYIYI